MGVDAVVGHSSASLGPSDKSTKKSKAKTTKRKAASQKSAASGGQHTGQFEAILLTSAFSLSQLLWLLLHSC